MNKMLSQFKQENLYMPVALPPTAGGGGTGDATAASTEVAQAQQALLDDQKKHMKELLEATRISNQTMFLSQMASIAMGQRNEAMSMMLSQMKAMIQLAAQAHSAISAGIQG